MSESNGLNKNQLQNAYQRPVANIYDLYLTGAIGDAKDYQDWNQMMRSATENDVVYIHINSNGGEIFTAIQLMRTMQETQATVIASVEGMCMSAATLLFLTADVCEVSEHSHFMFHTYSSGNWGKGSEQLANVMADDKWARHLFNTVYKGFLDPKEMESMIDGKDLWMNPAEVGKRLEKRNKLALKGKGPKKKEKALLSPKKTP
jgi:ATP-dependent protease ClpP protease subunit|tara:strand:- start:29065 stop:29676 length:612 start_codon:yes stop_codon:yes gene_type:complete